MYGFMVTLVFPDDMDDASIDELVLGFITMLEANGLSAGGGGERTFEFAVSRDGAPATSADRDILAQWASAHDGISLSTSELIDLNDA
ncbi:MAG: hypothetical protein JWM95_2186 [Gemmatimonadetes bacterium]|nr:hypothetical protein [Gemmatimonadota bacterium]